MNLNSSARRKRFRSFIDRLMAMMDVFDQTQALDLDSDEDATTIGPTTKENDKKPVGTLKVLAQKGFPETSYPIRRGENVVGRSIDLCQIHIPTKVLSKRHAVIEVDGDLHIVYDAGSHNKSFKGSLCLKPDVRYELRDGETLKFADVLCRYYKTYIPSANDDVTGSATETESIVDGPSTSSRPLNSSKKVKVVINEAQLDISHTSDNLLKGFELKSDSEVDDDDGDNVNSTVQSVAVPDTPITPENNTKKSFPRPSCPHPCSPDVYLETDSSTDIDENHSKLVEPLKSIAAIKVENSGTEAESSIDWENMQTQKFVVEESDHGMSKDHRAESDSNIDWENMQTEKFVMEEADHDLQNMQTQVYVMEGADHGMSSEEMLNAETQACPVMDVRPSEKVIELQVATALNEEVKDLQNVSNYFTSQSSDGEMRSAQATVANVLKSKVLCESQATSGVRDSVKVDSAISNDSDETISSSAIASKVDDSKMVASKKTARKSFSRKFDSDAPSTSGVQPACPVTPKETSKSHEVRPVNVSKLAYKEESSDFLPDPVALNVSLTSSPKTYSRMKRAKSESEVELSSNVKEAAGTVPSEPKPTEMTPTIRRKTKDTTGTASKVNEKEKETSLHVEGELKTNNASKDAVIGTSLEAEQSDKTPLNRRKTKETGPASKFNEKGEDPSPQQRPTAPNLRISLGSSPTCKMLGPSKSDDVPAAPINQKPSTSNGTRFNFKKLTSASKSAFALMATSTQLIAGDDQHLPDIAIEEVDEKDQDPIVKKSRRKRKADNTSKDLVSDNDDGDFKSPSSPLRRSSRKTASFTPTETEKEKPGVSKSKTLIKRKRQVADPTSDDENASSGSIQGSEVGQAKSVEEVETPRKKRRIINSANSSKASKDDDETFEYESEDELPTPPSFKSNRKARSSPTAAVDKTEQSNSNSSAKTKEKKKKSKTSRTEVAEEDDHQKEQEVTSKKSRPGRSSLADNDDEQAEQVVASKKSRRGRPSAAKKDEEQEEQEVTSKKSRPGRSSEADKGDEKAEQLVASKKSRRGRPSAVEKDEQQEEQEVTPKKGRRSRSAVANKDDDDSAFEQHCNDDDGQEELVTKSKKGCRARPVAATQKRKISIKEDSPEENVASIEKKRRKQRKNSVPTTTAASPRTSPRKSAVQPVAVEDDNDQNSSDESSEVRPKIMFTGLTCDAKLEKTIADLGGEMVDSVFDCTHLVTDKIRRTVKLLCALARGQPIVELKWLTHCKKAKSFIDCSPFIIADKPAEQQHGFVLSESLQKARQKCLLEEYSVHVTPSVMPVPNEMKLIIECARGKYLRVMPKNVKDGDRSTIVISCQKDISLCSTSIRKKIPVVTSEFILTGVLRQEVDVDTTTLVAR